MTKEERKEYNKQYYLAHRKELLERKHLNLLHRRLVDALWRAEHREEYNAAQRAWRRKAKEKKALDAAKKG